MTTKEAEPLTKALRTLTRQVHRVLACFAIGQCETVADVEAELDFTLTRHHIAGHIQGLIKAGKVERSGALRFGGVGQTQHTYRATARGRSWLAVVMERGR